MRSCMHVHVGRVLIHDEGLIQGAANLGVVSMLLFRSFQKANETCFEELTASIPTNAAGAATCYR